MVAALSLKNAFSALKFYITPWETYILRRWFSSSSIFCFSIIFQISRLFWPCSMTFQIFLSSSISWFLRATASFKRRISELIYGGTKQRLTSPSVKRKFETQASKSLTLCSNSAIFKSLLLASSCSSAIQLVSPSI